MYCTRTKCGWTPQNTTEKERFGLFALKPGEQIAEVWQCLHLLLWRQLIGMLVGIEYDDAIFKETTVWYQAWRRLKDKAAALSERAKTDIRRKESRGEEPPNMDKRANPMKPLASWTSTGDLVWNETLVEELNELAGVKK